MSLIGNGRERMRYKDGVMEMSETREGYWWRLWKREERRDVGVNATNSQTSL